MTLIKQTLRGIVGLIIAVLLYIGYFYVGDSLLQIIPIVGLGVLVHIWYSSKE